MRQAFEHWEKLALAAAVVWVGAYLLFGVALAGSDSLAPSTEALARQLGRTLGDLPGDRPVETPVRGCIERSFGPVAETAPGDEWVFYAPPAIRVVTRTIAPASSSPPKKVVRLGKPVLAGLAAETGIVRLTWEDDPATNVRIAGYLVYRRQTGETGFARIAADLVQEKVFTDERVPPKKDVQYAVSAVTDDAEAAKALGLGAGGEGPRSDAKSVRTLDEFALTLRIVSRFPPNRAGDEPFALARVTVRKFVDGTWAEKDYSVKKGDRIGRPETIKRAGRTLDVDFTTGFEVASIEPIRVARPEKVMRPTFDPKTAQKIGEEEVTVTRETPTWKLTYRDNEGVAREIVAEEGKRPASAAPSKGVTPVK